MWCAAAACQRVSEVLVKHLDGTSKSPDTHDPTRSHPRRRPSHLSDPSRYHARARTGIFLSSWQTHVGHWHCLGLAALYLTFSYPIPSICHRGQSVSVPPSSRHALTLLQAIKSRSFISTELTSTLVGKAPPPNSSPSTLHHLRLRASERQKRFFLRLEAYRVSVELRIQHPTATRRTHLANAETVACAVGRVLSSSGKPSHLLHLLGQTQTDLDGLEVITFAHIFILDHIATHATQP